MAFRVLIARQLPRVSTTFTATAVAVRTNTISTQLARPDLVKTNLHDMWSGSDVHVQATRGYVKSLSEESKQSQFWAQSVQDMVAYFDSDTLMTEEGAVPDHPVAVGAEAFE